MYTISQARPKPGLAAVPFCFAVLTNEPRPPQVGAGTSTIFHTLFYGRAAEGLTTARRGLTWRPRPPKPVPLVHRTPCWPRIPSPDAEVQVGHREAEGPRAACHRQNRPTHSE